MPNIPVITPMITETNALCCMVGSSRFINHSAHRQDIAILAIMVIRAIALYSITAFSHCFIYLRRLGRRAGRGRGRAVGRGRGRGRGRGVGSFGFGLFGFGIPLPSPDIFGFGSFGLLGSKIGPTSFPPKVGLLGRGLLAGLPPGLPNIEAGRLDRLIDSLPISFQRTSLPLVFQSLQQQ